MKREPVAVTTAMRFVLNALVQGLVIFGIVTLTPEQHGYLTVTVAGAIEAVLWLITRNEVWAPSGAPTHPPTEELWSKKLAAERVEYDQKLRDLFTAPGHPEPAFVAGTSLAVEEAQVDDVNPAPTA